MNQFVLLVSWVATTGFVLCLLRFAPLVYRTLRGKPAPPKRKPVMIRLGSGVPDGVRCWKAFSVCYLWLAVALTVLVATNVEAHGWIPGARSKEALTVFLQIAWIAGGSVLSWRCVKLGKFLEMIEL